MKTITLDDVEQLIERNERRYNADSVSAMRDAIAQADSNGSKYGGVRKDDDSNA